MGNRSTQEATNQFWGNVAEIVSDPNLLKKYNNGQREKAYAASLERDKPTLGIDGTVFIKDATTREEVRAFTNASF